MTKTAGRGVRIDIFVHPSSRLGSGRLVAALVVHVLRQRIRHAGSGGELLAIPHCLRSATRTRRLQDFIDNKLEVNLALGAWEISHLRQTELDRAGAISRAHRESMQMGQSAYFPVLRASQTMQPRRTPEEELPSKGALEELVTQLENGELRADILGAYLSKEQEEAHLRARGSETTVRMSLDGTWHTKSRRTHHHLRPRE